MADDLNVEEIAALRKKRQFKKFTFRGLELEQLLDLNKEELLNFVNARARRRMKRGLLKRKELALIDKVIKAKASTYQRPKVPLAAMGWRPERPRTTSTQFLHRLTVNPTHCPFLLHTYPPLPS